MRARYILRLGASILALVSSADACSLKTDLWSERIDTAKDWNPSVSYGDDSSLVAWQDATSARQSVLDLRSSAGRNVTIARADAVQLATTMATGLGAVSTLGLISGSPTAGVLAVDLRTGHLRRLTADPHLGSGVPSDRAWPTLLMAGSRSDMVWLAESDPTNRGATDYQIVVAHNPNRIRTIAHFSQVSYITLSPDGSEIGVAGSKANKTKTSLFIIDVATGVSRERLTNQGVG